MNEEGIKVSAKPILALTCFNKDMQHIFSKFQNFDGLDSFSETHIKSPLTGADKREKREKLYDHFLSSIDDINLVLYFGQLKLISGIFLNTILKLKLQYSNSI